MTVTSGKESAGAMEKPLFSSPGDICRLGGRGEEEARQGAEKEEGEGEEEEGRAGERRGVRWNPQLVSYQWPSEGGGAKPAEEERETAERSMTSQSPAKSPLVSSDSREHSGKVNTHNDPISMLGTSKDSTNTV